MFDFDATIQRLSGSARSFLAMAGSVVRNRGELFEIELKEQLDQAVLLAVMLGGMLLLAMLGAVGATAWAVYAAGEAYRVYVLLGLTLAYGLAAGIGTAIIFIKLRRYRDKAATAVAALRGVEARLAGEPGLGHGGGYGEEDADSGEERSWHSDNRS